MKKALAVIVILLFVYRYSYAQEQGLYEIKIEQDFEAYNNCKAQGYPYLSDMTITANDNKKDSVSPLIYENTDVESLVGDYNAPTSDKVVILSMDANGLTLNKNDLRYQHYLCEQCVRARR